MPAAVGTLLLALVLAAALTTDAPDGGTGDTALVVKKASFDSEAPVTAPAHWLPPEDWVYNHWLPFDETRLHELLGVTRGAIWRQLRDDRHNLAQLAARHGWPDAGPARRRARRDALARRHAADARAAAQRARSAR